MGVKKAKAKGKIDTNEKINLILFSAFYWIIYGIFYASVVIYLPATLYIFGFIPWAVQETSLGLGLALWGMISLLMGIKYRGDN